MRSPDPNPYASPLAESTAPAVELIDGLPLASRGSRFAAAVIDLLILLVFSAPTYFGLVTVYYPGYFADITFDNDLSPEQLAERTALAEASQPSELFESATGILDYGFYLLVNGYLLAKRGQTVGKWLLGIRIVRRDGSPAPLSLIVLWRALPFWIPGCVPYLAIYLGPVALLVDSLLIFRKSRRCLHDEVAQTAVVRVGAPH